MIPTITSPLLATAYIDQPFDYQIEAIGDPPVTIWNATNLPSGFSVNTSTGLISGVPTGISGYVDITISATNLSGTGNAVLRLNVLTLTPPVMVTHLDGEVAVPFSHTVTATRNPISFSDAGTLPPGVTLDSATGVISGTPTAEGVFDFDVVATNAAGTSTCAAALIITIAPASVALPAITSPLTALGRQGAPFEYQITATNDPTEYGATELPAGLSIDTTTGLISGTPMSDPGTYNVTLSATNVHGTRTATLRLTLREALPPEPIPVITSDDTAGGTVGLPFVYVIIARHSPFQFFATGLPQGLAINTQTGTIAGTPREMGTFHVQLSATNNGGTGTMTLTLVIAPTPAERPCPPPPPRKNRSGPDVAGIHCYIPDGCCGPDICAIDRETFICQIRSLLPEGEIFNNTRKPTREPARNVGTVTVGCARIGCEQLIFGGCCDDTIFCDDDPVAPQLAVVDSFAVGIYAVFEALCRMLPELDPCTADKFITRWASRMGISRIRDNFAPCGPEFSTRILAFLICFVLQLRYNRQRAVNWEFLEMVAARMSAKIVLRYAGDMNGVANSDEPFLNGWWSLARDAQDCPPIQPCPPEDASVGSKYDRGERAGRMLDEVTCAPPNQNSPLSLNIVICHSDIIIPENCNLPAQKSPLPFDAEMYDAFWWLLPQLLPKGPLWCLYECCEADCVV